MLRKSLISILAFTFVLAGSGCNRRADVSENSADSLLSVNPIEDGSGDLTPDRGYSDAPRPRRPSPSAPVARRITVPSGTAVTATIDDEISSETASVGQTWSGTVSSSVDVDGRIVIPAGSSVTGTVVGVRPARKGDRAMLDLALRSVHVDGRTYRVSGGTEAIVAGSARARNIGAIVGGTAAGALIGNAAGGKKGAVIGGVIGGATAGGVVAKSKGYQVRIKPGTKLTFTTQEAVAVRE
jgi:hypothetical protein